jgi:hypothetical protein
MKKFISLQLFIILNIITYLIATSCTSHTYLAIGKFERSIVESLLPPDYFLTTNLPEDIASEFQNNTYPLIFEFGQQNDCWMISTLTKHTFLEFKLEIPYVNHKDGHSSKVYKPFIYADNYMDTYGSKILYGLSTFKAEMELNESENISNYEVKTSEGKISATFDNSSLNRDFNSPENYVNFDNFKHISSTPWYCKSIFGNVMCADINYKWSNSKIRPVKISVKIEGNILGEKLSGKNFLTESVLEGNLGSVEFYVNIDIGLPYQCEN